ncbi:hypothetical protein NDU88_003362 [Pleurodeles waltl]|uniref:Integrase zinc-binding domain-containing protein n=1 Tax=Pleurodeles waltl TaxID=8319 RepID=A0AAV7MS08_PLEWA|nr:hypothetical protein NDU88_003362 [Pleurodeles waltl]
MRVLELAHEGHLGIRAMKCRVREDFWWPGVDRAFERYVRGCCMKGSMLGPSMLNRKRSTFQLECGTWWEKGKLGQLKQAVVPEARTREVINHNPPTWCHPPFIELELRYCGFVKIVPLGKIMYSLGHQTSTEGNETLIEANHQGRQHGSFHDHRA